MFFSTELIISIVAALAGLFLLVFVVNWRYFRDWIVVFLYNCVLDSLWGTAVIATNRLEFPFRQLPQMFKMSLLFDFWIFPVLCVLFNQVTRECGFWRVILYAVLFSAGVTAIEYPLEKFTQLIKYIDWNWYSTFFTLTLTFLSSRVFIAFYRWGCRYFGNLKEK